MKIGIYASAEPNSPLDALLEQFVRIDEAGFDTAWLGQVFEWDALTVLALAGRITRRVGLGSWIVPTPPRHPAALAQQALTVQAASGGRLTLGVGVSHEVVMARRLGLECSRPLQHAREYLEVLRPLLAGEKVAHAGSEFRVAFQLDPVGSAAPPILLAALGPNMLALAGHSADGCAIWLGGPSYLAGLAVPRVRAAAAAAARPEPRIACGLPLALTRDTKVARRAARAFLAASSKLPAYQRVVGREGAGQAADLALIGDENELERALDRLAGLGVTDFNAVLFPVPEDPEAKQRSFEFMAAQARRGTTRE